VQEGYLQQNPVDDIKLKPPKPPLIEPYKPEHVECFLQVLDHDWQSATTPRARMLAARNKAILTLLLESGLRLGELAALKVTDVDLDRQRVVVHEGKGGKGRVAGFGPQTKKALWRYIGLRPQEAQDDVLWLTEEGRPLARHGIQAIMRRLKRDTGIESIKGSVHKCRHTFGTSYLRHTADMKGCRVILGHSTLAMTERYTSFIEAEDALKAYNSKGPLDWMRD
jgi:site-specific recombinase XerD